MDAGRAQLARLLRRRRRRFRLLLVCLVTAGSCGAVAGLVGPRILIGGTAAAPADAAPMAGLKTPPEAGPPEPAPLDLAGCLDFDPREQQANAIRWEKMTPRERRAALDRYWTIARMDPAQKQRLLERYKGFRDLPEARRAHLRERARALREFIASLSPQDQAVLEGMDDDARARRVLELWQARYGHW